MCDGCARAIDIQAVAAKEATRFDHAVALFLPVTEWGALSCTSPAMVRAMCLLLRRWRGAALGSLSASTLAMVRCNRELLVGHPCWSGALRAAGIPTRAAPSAARVVPCRVLRCPRSCHPAGISVGIAVSELAASVADSPVYEGALRFLRSRAASDLVCYIEPLLRAAEKDMAALDLVLLPHCARCTEFATTVTGARIHIPRQRGGPRRGAAAHRAALLGPAALPVRWCPTSSTSASSAPSSCRACYRAPAT